MIESIETIIFRKIKRAKNDLLFSVNLFAKFGKVKAVSKALERLTKEEKSQQDFMLCKKSAMNLE